MDSGRIKVDGAKILRLKEQHNMTYVDVGERAGVSSVTVLHAVQQNICSLKTLKAIASAFYYDYNDLLLED